MPQVVTAVVSVVSTIVSSVTAAVTTVGATVGLSAGTSMAIAKMAASYALNKALMGKPSSPLSVSGSQTEFRADPNAGIPLVIGRTAFAGNAAFQYPSGASNKYLNQVIALSGAAPIESIESIKMDGVAITFNNSTGATSNSTKWSNKMWLKYSLGALGAAAVLQASTPAASSPSLQSMGVWTTQHSISGIAHAILSLEYDTNVYSGGQPSPLFIMKGVKAYDPRKDSTQGGVGTHRYNDRNTWEWSENPSICGLTYGLGWDENGYKANGANVPFSVFELQQFIDFANLCDTNNWKVGGVLLSTDKKWDNFKAILRAGGATPVPSAGKISLVYNSPKVSLATITMSDIKGGVSFPNMQSRRDRPNYIVPRYVSETKNWAITEATPVTSSSYQTADGVLRRKEVFYPLVQQPAQAMTLAAYDMTNAREIVGIVVNVGIGWSAYKIGDCLTLNLPEYGISNVKCVVRGKQTDYNSGTVNFTFDSETDSKHPFALSQTATAPSPPALAKPDMMSVSSPTSGEWSATAVTALRDGYSVPSIHVVGSSVLNPFASIIIIEYKKSSSSQWEPYQQAPAGALDFYIYSVEGSTNYDVAISYRSVFGTTSPRFVVSGLTTPVNSFMVEVANVSSDTVLSKGEKPNVKKEFDAIIGEYSSLTGQADKLNIDKTAFVTAYNALYTYLIGLSPSYADFTQDTTIVSATFNQKFTDYYAAKSSLITALTGSLAPQILSANTELTQNPNFAIWSGAANSFPDKWVDWNNGNGTSKSRQVGKYGSPYAIQFDLPVATGGAKPNSITNALLEAPLVKAGQPLVIEIVAEAVTNVTWRNFFAYLQMTDNVGNAITGSSYCRYIYLGDNKSIDGNMPSTGVAGDIRSFSIPFTPSVDGRAKLWIGGGWGYDVATAQSAKFHKASVRYASEGEMQAYRATTELANIASDSVLSKGEKPKTVQEWTAIYNESSLITAQANSLGVDDSARATAYNNLASYLGSLSPSWADYTQDTPINSSTFMNKFLDYYSAKEAELSAINQKLAQRNQLGLETENNGFDDWQNPSNLPNQWGNWYQTDVRKIRRDDGLGGFALGLPALVGDNYCGVVHQTIKEARPNSYIVIEGRCKLNSGQFDPNSTQFYANAYNTGLSAAVALQIVIGQQKEADGTLIGNGVVGRTYGFAKTFKLDATYFKLQMFCMNVYNGTALTVGNDITWLQCGWRYATEQEIRTFNMEDGADKTANQQITLSGLLTTTFDFAAGSPVSGQLPRSIQARAYKGGNEVTTGGVWSITNMVNCTVSVGASTGLESITALGSTGQVERSYVRVFTYNSVSYQQKVTIAYNNTDTAAVSAKAGLLSSFGNTISSSTWGTVAVSGILTINNAPASSIVSIEGGVGFNNPSGDCAVNVRLKIDGTVVYTGTAQQASTGGVLEATDFSDVFGYQHLSLLGAGTHTFSIEAQRTSGSGSVVAIGNLKVILTGS